MQAIIRNVTQQVKEFNKSPEDGKHRKHLPATARDGTDSAGTTGQGCPVCSQATAKHPLLLQEKGTLRPPQKQ